MLFFINFFIIICIFIFFFGGSFDLDFGRVSQLDDDFEDFQEELLVGGFVGQEGYGGQLQFSVGFDFFGGCYYNIGIGVIFVMYIFV